MRTCIPHPICVVPDRTCCKQVLGARVADAQLLTQLCRALDAFARCLAAFPHLMPAVMNKARTRLGHLLDFMQQ